MRVLHSLRSRLQASRGRNGPTHPHRRVSGNWSTTRETRSSSVLCLSATLRTTGATTRLKHETGAALLQRTPHVTRRAQHRRTRLTCIILPSAHSFALFPMHSSHITSVSAPRGSPKMGSLVVFWNGRRPSKACRLHGCAIAHLGDPAPCSPLTFSSCPARNTSS